ncbi:MAG: tRNA pseudouridine(55) synthase TruB [Holophagaceae bacterium]
MNSGLYLVHKPVGPSSASLVRIFQSRLKDAGLDLSVGHGGTLDPFASGLLLIMVGQATRLMGLFHGLPKGYSARVVWGAETDTGDPHGSIVRTSDYIPSVSEVENKLSSSIGWMDQIPPPTSAKKIKGVSAYKFAHRGEKVTLPPSSVYLHEAKLIDSKSIDQISLVCRGGFYVRSYIRDLGTDIRSAAHLSALHRDCIGPWSCPREGSEVFIHGDQLIPWCPSLDLTEKEFQALGFGQMIQARDCQSPEYNFPKGFPTMSPVIRGIFQGRLVALLRPEGNQFKTFANLRGGL